MNGYHSGSYKFHQSSRRVNVMALNIKKPTAERLALELGAATDLSLTDAVILER